MKRVGRRTKEPTNLLDSLNAYWQLLRPFNCVLAAVAAVIGFAASSGSLAWDPRLPALAAAVFLVCGAGQCINDYYDREIDAHEKKSRPIPSGRIGAQMAFVYAIVLFCAGNLLSWTLGPASLEISLSYSLLLFAYAALLNNTKYLGNLVVASATGATYLFGASLTGDYTLAAILAACAFFANLGREVAKDLEDIKTDEGAKTTLPMVIGAVPAKNFSALCYLASVPLAVAPAFIPTLVNSNPQWIPLISTSARTVLPSFTRLPFLILIAISSAVMIRAAWKVYAKDYTRSQKFSKAGMAIALLGYIAALAG
jgi:geranylgeranylglycerol-phosphate geranylgeranyltransferase